MKDRFRLNQELLKIKHLKKGNLSKKDTSTACGVELMKIDRGEVAPAIEIR